MLRVSECVSVQMVSECFMSHSVLIVSQCVGVSVSKMFKRVYSSCIKGITKKLLVTVCLECHSVHRVPDSF